MTATMTMKEAFSVLEVGKKYTLASMGEFGFPHAMNFVLTKIDFEKYAQYNDAVKIQYKGKGKRLERAQWLLPYSQVIIWPGWVSPNVEMYGEAEPGKTPGVTVSRSKFLSFDKGYMGIARASVEGEPLVEYMGSY
jgi:hypothetical protein